MDILNTFDSLKSTEEILRKGFDVEQVNYEDTPMGELNKNVSDITNELRRQADAQENILKQLEKETAERTKNDKKYFWLGAVVSFVIAILVEHGSELLEFLLQLFQ